MLSRWSFFRSLSWGLGCCPELQILKTIVIAFAIFMMDIFVGIERSTESLRHDETMLEHIVTSISSNIQPIIFGFKQSRDISIRASIGSILGYWICPSASQSTIGRFVTHISQNIRNLPLERPEFFSNLIARFAAEMPSQNLIRSSSERFGSSTHGTDSDSFRHQNPSVSIVVVPVGTTNLRESSASFIGSHECTADFFGDNSRWWHENEYLTS